MSFSPVLVSWLRHPCSGCRRRSALRFGVAESHSGHKDSLNASHVKRLACGSVYKWCIYAWPKVVAPPLSYGWLGHAVCGQSHIVSFQNQGKVSQAFGTRPTKAHVQTQFKIIHFKPRAILIGMVPCCLFTGVVLFQYVSIRGPVRLCASIKCSNSSGAIPSKHMTLL